MQTKQYNLALAVHIITQFALGVIAADETGACSFVSSKPEPHVKIGHSKNNLALVRASGYLEYINEIDSSSEPRYLPLSIKNYTLTSLGSTGNYHTLSIETNCADLFFHLVKDGLDWRVETVDVMLVVPNKGASSCHLRGFHITQKHRSHFKCDSNERLSCMKGSDGVVYVVAPKFEFEVFGSPEKVMNDEFSTNHTACP